MGVREKGREGGVLCVVRRKRDEKGRGRERIGEGSVGGCARVRVCMHERDSQVGSAGFQSKPRRVKTTNISQSCSWVSVRSDHQGCSLRSQ